MEAKRSFRMCLSPYEDYKSSGPYFCKSTGRLHIHLLKAGSRHLSMQYARYLMSVHLGIVIPKGIEIDHIDGDRTNDTFENLRMLSNEENRKKSKEDPRSMSFRSEVSMVCPGCFQRFTKRAGDTHLTKKSSRYTYCTKECYLNAIKAKKVIKDSFDQKIVKTRYTFEEANVFIPWEDVSVFIEPLSSLAEDRFCSFCKKPISSRDKDRKFCSYSCAHLAKKRHLEEPELAVLTKALQKEITWLEAGRLLGISDNGARKRARSGGLM